MTFTSIPGPHKVLNLSFFFSSIIFFDWLWQLLHVPFGYVFLSNFFLFTLLCQLKSILFSSFYCYLNRRVSVNNWSSSRQSSLISLSSCLPQTSPFLHCTSLCRRWCPLRKVFKLIPWYFSLVIDLSIHLTFLRWYEGPFFVLSCKTTVLSRSLSLRSVFFPFPMIIHSRLSSPHTSCLRLRPEPIFLFGKKVWYLLFRPKSLFSSVNSFTPSPFLLLWEHATKDKGISWVRFWLSCHPNSLLSYSPVPPFDSKTLLLFVRFFLFFYWSVNTIEITF